MTGPKQSVLGVKSEIIINRLKSNDMSKFEAAINRYKQAAKDAKGDTAKLAEAEE
jgi:calcineurin-like phosphoesterase